MTAALNRTAKLTAQARPLLGNLLFDYMLVAIAAMLLSYITKATPKAEEGIAE